MKKVKSELKEIEQLSKGGYNSFLDHETGMR